MMSQIHPLVPSRRMPQHTEFMNGTYNFPAKPRNQWEIGVKGWCLYISVVMLHLNFHHQVLVCMSEKHLVMCSLLRLDICMELVKV